MRCFFLTLLEIKLKWDVLGEAFGGLGVGRIRALALIALRLRPRLESRRAGIRGIAAVRRRLSPAAQKLDGIRHDDDLAVFHAVFFPAILLEIAVHGNLLAFRKIRLEIFRRPSPNRYVEIAHFVDPLISALAGSVDGDAHVRASRSVLRVCERTFVSAQIPCEAANQYDMIQIGHYFEPSSKTNIDLSKSALRRS